MDRYSIITKNPEPVYSPKIKIEGPEITYSSPSVMIWPTDLSGVDLQNLREPFIQNLYTNCVVEYVHGTIREHIQLNVPTYMEPVLRPEPWNFIGWVGEPAGTRIIPQRTDIS